MVDIENNPEINGESSTMSTDLINISLIADIGHDLRKDVKLANEVLKSLMATTLLTCVVSLALGLYVVVASTSLYNKTDTTGLNIFSAFIGFVCFVYFTRLYFLLTCGQQLSDQMKQGKYNLEEYRLQNFESLKENMELKYKMDILQQRLGGEFPIIPYSVFGLSNFTFMRCMIAVIGYVVVLIMMRGVEMPNDDMFSINARNLTVIN